MLVKHKEILRGYSYNQNSCLNLLLYREKSPTNKKGEADFTEKKKDKKLKGLSADLIRVEVVDNLDSNCYYSF